MLDELLLNKIPSDSTIVVINSVMAALDETESLQKARKVMANRQAFIQRLYEYKYDRLSLVKVKQLKQYLGKPAYNPKEVERTKSRGTVQLAKWIYSLVAFYDTNNLKKKDLRKVKNPNSAAKPQQAGF